MLTFIILAVRRVSLHIPGTPNYCHAGENSSLKPGFDEEFNITIEEQGVLTGRCYIIRWHNCVDIRGTIGMSFLFVSTYTF